MTARFGMLDWLLAVYMGEYVIKMKDLKKGQLKKVVGRLGGFRIVVSCGLVGSY